MNKEVIKNKNIYSGLILGLILMIALIMRLWKISTPLADFHSWRQADTAAVARNFQRSGYDLLKPRFDDLSSMQSGRLNPYGYRFVEFPIYNAVVAILSQSSHLPIHIAGRLITIFSSLILLIVIFKLLQKNSGNIAAIFGAFFFASQPFIVSYSRVVLPDMVAITLAFLAIYLAEIVSDKNDTKVYLKFFFTSAILGALALLVKPTTLFFLLPLIYLYIKNGKVSVLSLLRWIGLMMIIISPLFFWRLWISRFPEGIPASQWLITSVSTGGGMVNIFFRPAFFRWIFFERILVMIGGGFSFVFIAIGGISLFKQTKLIQMIFLSSLLFLFVFQGGNVQHDYYQIMIFPAISILVGIGVQWLINSDIADSVLLKVFSVSILIIASWGISYQTSKFHYDINMGLVKAGINIDNHTEKNSLIATDTAGDTSLLYLSDRKGFPIFEDLEVMRNAGINYLATFRADSKAILGKSLKKVFDDGDIVIFSLKEPKN